MGFNWWGAVPAMTKELRVQDIVDRVQAEAVTKAGLWPVGWPHEAPEQPLSVPEAHKAMQNHHECRADECPRKAAAREALIAAGRMRPDTSRER